MKPHVEIDETLAAQLESAAKARGMSFRDFVSGVLKDSVAQSTAAAPPPPPRYVLRTFDFGVHIESPWTVLAELESQEYAPKVNKK